MKFLFFITFVLLQTSCVSLKQNSSTGIQPLSASSGIEGVFSRNIPKYGALHYFFGGNFNVGSATTETVSLKTIDHKHIELSLIYNDSLAAKQIIKGKVKNNYFVSRHKRTIIPFIPIFGIFENKQIQFSLSQDQTLKVETIDNKWGCIFFYCAENTSRIPNRYLFNKLEK
ncbi:MAG: hypothetical protein ACK5NB_09865 [Flavobacteriaceae bacterium]